MTVVKRLLLLMHSTPWRMRFGAEYAELLDRKPLDTFEILDAFRSSSHSHARLQSWAPLAVALAGALCSGFLSLRNGGPQSAAVAIMLFSFLLTIWKPQHWWLWLSVGTLSIPCSYAFAGIAHLVIATSSRTMWHGFGAFGPALVAATAAMCLRISIAVYGCRKRRSLNLGLSTPE